MKKTLLTIALLAVASVATYAQGTINPLNGTLTRVRVDTDGNNTYSSADRTAEVGDNISVGVFWGAAGGEANTLAGTLTIAPRAAGATQGGILTGLPAIWDGNGANWGEVNTTISLQMRVLTGGEGRTAVAQVKLGPANGPGAVVWNPTATADKFAPLLVTIPEPSTIALGVLGLGSLLLFRRRK